LGGSERLDGSPELESQWMFFPRTRESILSPYPYLEKADIDAALRYAACLSEDETIELRR
jgi:hypothetical protein